MIIIPELKVIFVRPAKTSGSSLANALFTHLGYNTKDDNISYQIATIRRNTSIKNASRSDIDRLQHAPCSRLKPIVNKDIWNDYLKISIIRCPYDTLISYYYWDSCRNVGKYTKNFNLYALQKTYQAFIKKNYNIPCINNRLAIDFLMRFENMQEDVKKLEQRINCPGLLQKYNRDHWIRNLRPPGQDVNKVYAKYPLARAMIDKELSEAMENEVIRKYYPLYKKKLNEKVPEPSYFLIKIADLLIHLYKHTPKSSHIVRYLRRFSLRLSRESTSIKKLV